MIRNWEKKVFYKLKKYLQSSKQAVYNTLLNLYVIYSQILITSVFEYFIYVTKLYIFTCVILFLLSHLVLWVCKLTSLIISYSRYLQKYVKLFWRTLLLASAYIMSLTCVWNIVCTICSCLRYCIMKTSTTPLRTCAKIKLCGYLYIRLTLC